MTQQIPLIALVTTLAWSLSACSNGLSTPGDADQPSDDADVQADGDEPDLPDADDADEPAPADADRPPPEDADTPDSDTLEPVAWDPEAVTPDDATFPDGLHAGAATESTIILWTRYLEGAPLRARIWREASPGHVYLDHDGDVEVDENGFVHHHATGLTSGQWYSWGFFTVAEDGSFEERTTIGRFRTAPAPDALEIITFSGTHGTNQDYHPFRGLEVTAEFEIDFLIHVGDATYNDGADTIEDLWSKWSENWNDPGFRAVFPITSYYPVWDDHEVEDNWDPEEIDEGYRDRAMEAYFDYNAVPRFAESPHRVWTSYRWGQTAEIFILDCRSERIPSTRRSSGAEYISLEQMDWLQDGLQRSDAVFKLIVNSVPISHFPFPFSLATEDRWEGYPAQREEILDFIVDLGIENVYWLSGDFHLATVQRIDSGDRWSNMIEILMGPGGSARNPLGNLITAENFFYSTDQDTATIITLDPTEEVPELVVSFYNTSGELLFTELFPN